jgi:cytochrome oxidase Cu insertion factor (SCO1/SenC/PrrC family)
MKKTVALMSVVTLVSLPTIAIASGEPGKSAPVFSVTDLDGKPVTLTDVKGRWVALEWTNPDCPFVQKHYNSKNMQDTQRMAAGQNITWVQINSTNPNHGEYKTPQQMKSWNSSMQALLTHATLDTSGKAGKAYGAKTTPQMVLISPDGKVVYNGAIDSIRSANPADIPNATNYVKQAMAEVAAGKPVSTPSTTPYGCSIKY